MAKITINEIDNSSASAVTTSTNIVYVPGYSIKGPVNTPTLCSSVSEFREIFGNNAYQYKNEQKFSDEEGADVVAKAYEYDKSYFYALELLKQGLPILFERIVDDSNLDTASLKLTFKNKIRVGTPVKETYKNVYSVKSTVTGPTKEWELYKVDEKVEGAKFDEADDAKTVKVTVSEGDIVLDGEEFNISTEDSDTNTENYVTIYAKYPGQYGTTISVSIDELTDDKQYPIEPLTRRFELYINDTRYVVNFDVESDFYILKKLAYNKDVRVESNLSPAYIDSNLYGIISKDKTYLEYEETTEDEMSFARVKAVLNASESDAIPSPYYKLQDKTIYDVKFITSGIYASMDESSSSIASKMLDCAATRRDAFAIIDIKKGIDKKSYFDLVSNSFPTTYVNGEDRNNYGTIIAPSVKVTLSSTGTDEWMPASFAYLYALASSVKNNPIWLAVAGVVRGQISNFKDIEFIVDEGVANKWQADTTICINPIRNVRPYGYCIDGNRTLSRNLEGLKDNSFTNVRLLVIEAKKIANQAMNRLMFESNDSVLWNNFKSLVEPTLEQMKSNRGITDYKITRLETTKKASVAGLIRIMPIEAVEDFTITFSLEDNVVTVE